MTRVRIALPAIAPAVAAAAVIALGLGAAAPAAAAPTTAVTASAVSEAEGLDVHRGKYVSLGGCQTAGQQGIERGHWDQYQCAQGSFWLWSLWTNR
ncbi:hypothetical protein ACFYV5_31685 [Streptomyces sp. NPDC003035]|uniref:hypothetical protein n=1 Tax=Streptomyces sp. NPDC003035 TaxID=3364676 RepID=UPI0036B6E776